MSIFDRIKNSIFGKAEAAEPAAPRNAPAPSGAAPTPSPTPAPPTAQTSATPKPSTPQAPQAPAPAPTASTSSTSAAPAAEVDVEAIMDKAVKDSGQKLDWRKSIVDMLKALHLDSSLSERQELAKELGYTGDANDSSKMNVWLHKALMKKLSENGGKVPAELTD